MKILCVCDQGNNRSVHLAYLLKYSGHDVLTAGLKTNTQDTLTLLYTWADKILTTASDQEIPHAYQNKAVLYDVGEDRYRRPLNHQLTIKFKKLLIKNPI